MFEDRVFGRVGGVDRGEKWFTRGLPSNVCPKEEEEERKKKERRRRRRRRKKEERKKKKKKKLKSS